MDFFRNQRLTTVRSGAAKPNRTHGGNSGVGRSFGISVAGDMDLAEIQLGIGGAGRA
jgi:hypothetical protein